MKRRGSALIPKEKTPMFSQIVSRVRSTVPILAALAVASCSGGDGTAGPSAASPRSPSFGKTATSVTVTSVAPDSGALSTTLDIKVNGSGFTDGMVALWTQSGTADSTQIKTNSTHYVSAKQLVANITITGRATSGQWDVSIYSGGKTGVGSEIGVLKNGFKVTDPTATWLYPLNDAGLGVRSDHLYSDGGNSVYANGVCNLATRIYATTVSTSSGDATLNTGQSNRCARHFTYVYPDGVTESMVSFNNLRVVENLTHSIPVGTTMQRQLHMGSEGISNTLGRCGGLVWGYGEANNVGAGSDSVLVTRLDAQTWHVTSAPPPHNLAWCKTTGQLFAMPVDFTIVSSRPLP
jgi:hypothetical protein